MRQALSSVDRWFFTLRSAQEVHRAAQAARLLAVLIALRVALGPYRELAGQPRELFRPRGLLVVFDAMPPWGVIVAIQLVGVAAAVLATVRRGRLALPVAWVCLVVLAGLRGSLGKILHNDVLLILTAVPFVIAALSRDRNGREWAPRAALVVISLAYFFSGYQKLLNSGLDWVFSDNFRWVLYGGAASGRAPTDTVARFIADRPGLAVASAGALLLMELAFPVVLFGARTRPLLGVIAVVMHAGTWLTLGLDYWTWVAVDAIVLLYATAPLTRSSAEPERARARPAADARPEQAASGTG